MAEKKAVIILAESAALSGAGAGFEKLLKKAAVFNKYSAGTILDGSVAGENIAKAAPAELAAVLENGAALVVVDLKDADSAALNAALETTLEALDRRSVLAVIAKGAAALYGLGVNAKAGALDRAAGAGDILPTLAFIADIPITGSCTGAILYQALKSPNLKLDEINKLKEALTRMEGALARDNREPWDKHDCA